MKCADCGEPVLESERPAVVRCGCRAVLHAECALSDVYTARSYCEECYYDPRRVLRESLDEPEAEA